MCLASPCIPKSPSMCCSYPCCPCTTSGMQISWRFTASEVALMSAGNKCPAKCRDQSSDPQTNKCGVWVRGDIVDLRLWNFGRISESLLETPKIPLSVTTTRCKDGRAECPGMWIWRGTKHRVVLRAMWDEQRETEETGPCLRGPVSCK